MIINVKAHTNTKKLLLKKIDDKNYEIWIKEIPEKNKANIEIIKMLKNHFKKEVRIKSGFTSRKKRVEIK
jgi:uncharacterized protein (TIGR00251 family)